MTIILSVVLLLILAVKYHGSWRRQISILIFCTLLVTGVLPVSYYFLRNKVIAHHTNLIHADDSIQVNWFRWWGYPAHAQGHWYSWKWNQKAMELGMFLANPGGAVHMPPNYTETLSANLVLKKSTALVFDGPATITQGVFQITGAGTIGSYSIVNPYGFMSNGATQFVNFVYTGTSQAVAIGDSVTASADFYMRGISILISGNGASCLILKNINEFNVSDSKCSATAGTSPIGIITNGTGVFTGVGKFDNVQVIMRGTNSIGYQFQTLTTHTQIIGGNIDLDAGASAVCFDVQGPSTQSIELMMPNANTCNTAVQVESTATSVGAIVGDFRIDSGVVTAANFATGTLANQLRCINCSNAALVTDAGSNNSVEFPINNQVNGKSWRTVQAANDYELQNKATAKDRFAATTSNSFMDAEGTGVNIFNSLSGGTGGEQFCHGDNTHCLIMNPSPSANRTWTIQDASGTVPLEIASGTSTFTTTAVTAGTCQTTVTTAATNALTTDTISVAYASAPTAATDGMLTLQMYVTAGNVNFMRCNPTAGSITPTALVLNWRVVR